MPDRVKIVVPKGQSPANPGLPRLAQLEPWLRRRHVDRPTARVGRRGRSSGLGRHDPAQLARRRRVAGDVLRQLPTLKFITVFGIGTDSIDLQTAKSWASPSRTSPARRRGRRRARLRPDAGGGERRLPGRRAARGRWGTRIDNIYLNGKTLGVIGFGPIGARMAALGKAIGMNVIAWTFVDGPGGANGRRARRAGRPAAARSDVVSLHLGDRGS